MLFDLDKELGSGQRYIDWLCRQAKSDPDSARLFRWLERLGWII